MSYARFGEDSDVYIYDDGEKINCCGCKLDGDFASDVFDDICDHLTRHLDAGHKVPWYCIERLFHEALAGDWGKEKWESPPYVHWNCAACQFDWWNVDREDGLLRCPVCDGELTMTGRGTYWPRFGELIEIMSRQVPREEEYSDD